MSGKGIIYRERSQQCDLCGKIAELRPYGPKGECICPKCCMQDEESARRGADKLLFGKGRSHD